MAFDFDWSTILGPLLVDRDILGTKGCAWPIDRTSILVEVSHTIFNEDEISLICDQYLPAKDVSVVFQTVGIEMDINIATTFAISHAA